ncbi:MAG: four helix bundle protein [Chloroflexi bacterium]|nr:four helix bundle protein [Chloroflexota bacterium]
MAAKHFRELRVYQLAFRSAIQIYEWSRSFPTEERCSLTDQIRHSSRSVCVHIAEAWRKRRYPNHFSSKLSDVDGEAAETIVWLDFALGFGFLSAEQHETLADRYDHICSQFALMMASPDSWTPKARMTSTISSEKR